MNTFYLLTQNFPIYEQLRIEEAFLRTSTDQLVWINSGSKKSIVLGISSKVDELIHVDQAVQKEVEIIRRYSGGGTVVVDENTIFVSFICDHSHLKLPPFPLQIMEWSAQFYQFLNPLKFALKENDYTLDEKKFGGNAQYLTKSRFVHHSTLLYAFNPELMQLLKLPKKAPNYRAQRDHQDFLVTLDHYFPSKEEVVENLVQTIQNYFNMIPTSVEELLIYTKNSYRQSTHKVTEVSSLHSDHLNQIDQKTLV
jgi:lipoate-protein ligase A